MAQSRRVSLTVTAPAATAAAELVRTLAAIVRGHHDARLSGKPDGRRDWLLNAGGVCLAVIASGTHTRLDLPYHYGKHDLARPVTLVFPGVSRAVAFEAVHSVLRLNRAPKTETCRALVPVSHYRSLQQRPEFRQVWLRLAVADFLAYATQRSSSAPRVQVIDLESHYCRQGVEYANTNPF